MSDPHGPHDGPLHEREFRSMQLSLSPHSLILLNNHKETHPRGASSTQHRMVAGFTLVLIGCSSVSALKLDAVHELSRRTAIVSGVTLASMPLSVLAGDEAPVVLTDEEMAARVARKQELLRRQGGLGASGSALDVRSDINPEAGVNLRSRSIIENTKSALAKQEEMRKRDTATKRDDLCEMLGRGC